ncbi:MAG: YceD family protein [Gemmatimonadaceae bacterium]
MLSYDIRELEEHAVHVDGRLRADDPVWQEGDALPKPYVRASGRLSKAGSGRFYWTGRVEGEADTSCRRCLVDVRVPVQEDVGVIFAADDDTEVEDDPDVFRIAARAHMLDLRPAVREQWLLGVPSFALCREDCQGLCPACGADRNAGDCACEPARTDGRWDTLRALRRPSD